MANKHGDFIWYELMTNDADAAQDFYGALLGWTFVGSGQEGMDYRIFSAGDNGVGGFFALTPEMEQGGAKPCWTGYINVEDVDRMAQAITSANGSVHMEPQSVPGVGRFAFVADPQGALFYIMNPEPPADDPDRSSNSFAATEPMVGHCAWNELATSDPEAGMNFYHDLFGWAKDGEMDMGAMGKYEFLRHDFMIGAMMPKMPQMPVSAWSYYFRVANIDDAILAINANGGKVIHGPNEIPGGDFSMTGVDPQGAVFSLVGAK
jgi:uncharacterized protein